MSSALQHFQNSLVFNCFTLAEQEYIALYGQKIYITLYRALYSDTDFGM